jgi:ribosome-binding factor A
MIRDALVEVFRHDLRGVNVGFASVTDIEVSPDLHYARVYMSGLKEDETRATVDALQEARGQVRYALGKRIRLRYTPELDFRYDETTMRASRIEEILMQVLPKKAKPEETDGDEVDEPDDESDDQADESDDASDESDEQSGKSEEQP